MNGVAAEHRRIDPADLVGKGNPGALAREYEFTERDFDAVRKLIHARAGISLSEAKMDMVYSRIAPRLHANGLKRFQDYIAMLDGGGTEAEWEAFTNSLTTNLTSFFREAHHFEIFAGFLADREPGRAVKVWSCAASTGEEPYSIAMTAVRASGRVDCPVSILATDIDTQVLRKARTGIYPIDRIEKLPTGKLRPFFLRGVGDRAGFAKVKDEVRALVEFRQLNLLDRHWPQLGPFDAIFCRNVMIYFDKPTQAQLLKRLAPLLAPDGLLFVGHSETLLHVTDVFELQGKTVYRKTASHAA